MESAVRIWNAAHRNILDQLKNDLAQFFQIDRGKEIVNAEQFQNIPSRFSVVSEKTRYYLARSFQNPAKCDCSMFHYRWVIENIVADRLYDILDHKVEFWFEDFEDQRYLAKIHLERFVAREGEVSIDLLFGGKPIFVGSFSIVPANMFALEGREAILVSRLQGGKDNFDHIRLATKAMADVAPKAVFFAILTGIAKAAGIEHIVGVTAENYVNFRDENREALERQYDAFYQSVDAVGPHDGFYVLNVWAEKKPVNAVKVGHRVRTRRKRILKEKISAAAMTAFSAFLNRPAGRN